MAYHRVRARLTLERRTTSYPIPERPRRWRSCAPFPVHQSSSVWWSALI